MSKIASIKEREWNGKKFWDIEMEDGLKGSCWSPEFATYKVGDEADFDVSKDNKGYNRLKLKGSFKGGGGFRGKSPEELAQQQKTMVLAYAKDLTIATLQASGQAITPEETANTWKKFFNFGMELVK